MKTTAFIKIFLDQFQKGSTDLVFNRFVMHWIKPYISLKVLVSVRCIAGTVA